MGAHTPGPWEVDRESLHFQWTDSIGIRAIAGGTVAWTTRGGPEPKWEDAALIAASPDLLDVVKTLLALRELVDGAAMIDENSTLIDAARDAVAKAEGQS